MRNRRKFIGLIVITLIALPFITRFGYCWGWWLQSNPWAYYWWLCGCGAKTEQKLYPDNVEIVVSACREPNETILSPDGRYLIVRRHLQRESYLFDLVTGEEQPWLYPFWSLSDIEFRTNRLVRVSIPNQKVKLVDVTDNSSLNLSVLPVNRDGQKLIDSSTLEILRDADRVIIREGSSIIHIIALAAQPKQKSAENYRFSLRNKTEQEMLETIFLENGITYEKWVYCSRWSLSPCVSHNGRFTATDSAIFTASDRNLITKRQGGPSLNLGAWILGWAHDDSGVYIQLNPDSYIIDSGFVTPPLFRLPQPIIKLDVPDEYR